MFQKKSFWNRIVHEKVSNMKEKLREKFHQNLHFDESIKRFFYEISVVEKSINQKL